VDSFSWVWRWLIGFLQRRTILDWETLYHRAAIISSNHHSRHQQIFCCITSKNWHHAEGTAGLMSIRNLKWSFILVTPTSVAQSKIYTSSSLEVSEDVWVIRFIRIWQKFQKNLNGQFHINILNCLRVVALKTGVHIHFGDVWHPSWCAGDAKYFLEGK
jgi:hypothetical protein